MLKEGDHAWIRRSRERVVIERIHDVDGYPGPVATVRIGSDRIGIDLIGLEPVDAVTLLAELA